jgi:LuxR family transcriptional regulator, maltose regulon positive regulatory protein
LVTTRPKGQSYIIKRPRLTRLLDESEARIILLCAPAGYGKTTLAREWVEESRHEWAWYSLRPTDCDVAGLASGLAGLFAGPQIVDPVERVRSLAASGQPIEALAHTVAVAAARRGAILVIDDYHHAIESAEANDFIRELVLRTTLRIVLTSRVRPDWLTARNVVYGDATVIGRDDLAFTDQEAREALGGASGSENPAILDMASGWPAIIGMAAVQEWVPPISPGLAPSALYDFLADELFGSVQPRLQESLLCLAAGGDANLNVARELLGIDFDDVMAEADLRGFVSHDPDGSPTIHPLLRDFLLTRLRRQGQRRIAAVAHRVVRLLVEARCWDACLTTLQRFPDKDLIASSMIAAMADLLASGRVTTVRQWLDLARSEEVSHPIFLLADAELALRQGRNAQAQVLADRAAALFGNGEEAARAHLAAARAAHLREDLAGTAKNAERASALSTDAEVRQEALWLAFASALETQAPEADRYLTALSSLDNSDTKLALRVACAEALRAHEYGRTFEAISVCERAEALLTHVRDPLQVTGFLNVYAHIAFCAANYARSLELVDRLVVEANSAGLDFPLSYALVTRAGALTGLRQLLPARRALVELNSHEPLSAHVAGNAILTSAKICIAAGDLAGAAAALEVDPPDGSRTPFLGELAGYRGLVQASRGFTHEARSFFAVAEDASSYIDTVTTVALGRAVVALEDGDPNVDDETIHAVRSVLDSGNQEVIVAASRAYPALPATCANDATVARRLAALFVTSNDTKLARRSGLKTPRQQMKRGGRLSIREREVCQLLALGKSNREIASALFISESTTKVHVRHIFEKLGARTRAEVAALLTEDDLRER